MIPIEHEIRRWVTALLVGVAALAAVYAVSSYEFVPAVWRIVERRHPALDHAGTRSVTSAGIPGDPLNIAFVGSESGLIESMLAAQWFPADPITLRSALRLALDVVAHRPYLGAPVSDLYVDGRRQDLAFEAQSGTVPSSRHHVRFWRMPQLDQLDRPLWVGAATFDVSAGISHNTGQLTHHIAPEIDRERDKLVADLERLEYVKVNWVDGFQPEREGRNGGGDRFFTDGRLAVITLAPR